MKPTFFNDLSIPVIAAPMFLISGPEIVISCCKNGIVGTFPALNNRTTEGLARLARYYGYTKVRNTIRGQGTKNKRQKISEMGSK